MSHMNHTSADNDVDELKMDHDSKMDIDSVVNESGGHLSPQIHMQSSELEGLSHHHGASTSGFDTSLLMQQHQSMTAEDITNHLASSGMAGVAAAAAIATSHRKSMLYNFETVPAVRKRHSTRLLRKIQQLVDEFSVRVGQQACLLVCSPKSAFKSPNDSLGSSIVFKVFGASPLDQVLRGLKDTITLELENALQNYQMMNATVSYYQPIEVLPPLMVDGIPTPLDKMTQAQLRAFIPVMLKYSTGRTKPAWGRPASRPPWWPDDVPWANVRSDVRTDEEKQRQSWTNALKKVVRSCYEYHGKAHYLHDYSNTSGIGGSGNNGDMIVDPHNHHHHGQLMDPSQMMDHSQMIDMDHHHHHPVDYSNPHDHHHMTNHQVSGRHMLLSEQDAVEAQLRALQSTYGAMSSTHEHSAGLLMNLDAEDDSQQQSERNNQMVGVGANNSSGMTDYASLTNDPSMATNGSNIKVEDFVNLPPGAVVQLDSNSTAELFNLLAGNSTTNNNTQMSETENQGGSHNGHPRERSTKASKRSYSTRNTPRRRSDANRSSETTE